MPDSNSTSEMNPLEASSTDYQSYLLRVWRDAGRGVWHVSLQSTLTKRVYHFAEAKALLEFLAAPTATSTDDDWIGG